MMPRLTVHTWAALSGRRKIQPLTFWIGLPAPWTCPFRSCSRNHQRVRYPQVRCEPAGGHRASRESQSGTFRVGARASVGRPFRPGGHRSIRRIVFHRVACPLWPQCLLTEVKQVAMLQCGNGRKWTQAV
jgi:hypothetical protein